MTLPLENTQDSSNSIHIFSIILLIKNLVFTNMLFQPFNLFAQIKVFKLKDF